MEKIERKKLIALLLTCSIISGLVASIVTVVVMAPDVTIDELALVQNEYERLGLGIPTQNPDTNFFECWNETDLYIGYITANGLGTSLVIIQELKNAEINPIETRDVLGAYSCTDSRIVMTREVQRVFID